MHARISFPLPFGPTEVGRRSTPRNGAVRPAEANGDSLIPSCPSNTLLTLHHSICETLKPHRLVAPFLSSLKYTGRMNSAAEAKITPAPKTNPTQPRSRNSPKKPAARQTTQTAKALRGSFRAKCTFHSSSCSAIGQRSIAQASNLASFRFKWRPAKVHTWQTP